MSAETIYQQIESQHNHDTMLTDNKYITTFIQINFVTVTNFVKVLIDFESIIWKMPSLPSSHGRACLLKLDTHFVTVQHHPFKLNLL